MSKKNRTSGHNAERLYADIFRKLGFSNCRTSRQESRINDDAGIDLTNIPFNVQIKEGFQRGLNHSSTLRYIADRVSELGLDHLKGRIRLLIHRKKVGRGKKRTDEHDLVIMTFKDFTKLIQKKDATNNT